VSCTSWTRCLAVGTRAAPKPAVVQPLAERWDGTRWRVVPTPAPSTRLRAALAAVSCLTGRDCVAVGYQYQAGEAGYITLAEQWNGSGWQITQSINPAAVHSAFLNGVSCWTTSGCVAIGGRSAGPGAFRAFAELWTRGRWKVLRLRLPAGATSSELDGISCDGLACMAVGTFRNSAGEARTLAEHWTGASWHFQKPANARTPISVLQDVSCNSSTLCLAVGISDLSTEKPLTERWQDGHWQIVPGEEPSGGSLTGISCPGSDWCIAVGSVGLRPLTEAWSGGSWKIQKSPLVSGHLSEDLSQISCRTKTVRCISVGTSYQPAEPGTDATLAQWWDGQRWWLMRTRNP